MLVWDPIHELRHANRWPNPTTEFQTGHQWGRDEDRACGRIKWSGYWCDASLAPVRWEKSTNSFVQRRGLASPRGEQLSASRHSSWSNQSGVTTILTAQSSQFKKSSMWGGGDKPLQTKPSRVSRELKSAIADDLYKEVVASATAEVFLWNGVALQQELSPHH